MSASNRKPRLAPSEIDCISQEEAMTRLGVSRSTLYAWRRQGRIKCIAKFGRVRVLVSSIHELMSA